MKKKEISNDLQLMFTFLNEAVKDAVSSLKMNFVEGRLISKEFDTHGKYKFEFTFMELKDYKKYLKYTKAPFVFYPLFSKKRKNKMRS